MMTNIINELLVLRTSVPEEEDQFRAQVVESTIVTETWALVRDGGGQIVSGQPLRHRGQPIHPMAAFIDTRPNVINYIEARQFSTWTKHSDSYSHLGWPLSSIMYKLRNKRIMYKVQWDSSIKDFRYA